MEAQEIEEKEYDLKLSVKPQINISETLQKNWILQKHILERNHQKISC